MKESLYPSDLSEVSNNHSWGKIKQWKCEVKGCQLSSKDYKQNLFHFLHYTNLDIMSVEILFTEVSRINLLSAAEDCYSEANAFFILSKFPFACHNIRQKVTVGK